MLYHAWVNRPFAWVFTLMTSAEFPMLEIPNLEFPVMRCYFRGRRRLSAILKVQISSGIPHHHPQMPWLSYGQTRILMVQKSFHVKVSGGIQVSPKMKSNSGASSSSVSTQFYISGSSIKKIYPQTVAVVRPRVRVTVREKRSYLAFSSTSGYGKVLPRILEDPAITWYPQFLSPKNFFIFLGQNLVINFGLAINTNARVNIHY